MADPVSLKPIGTTPSQPLHLVVPEQGTISHRFNKDNDRVQVLQRRISKSPPKRHQDHGDYSDKNDALNSSASKDVVAETARLGLSSAAENADSGRERLKRHRSEVAGRVWIPEIWGQEELLNDWIDCSAFDASLTPTGIMSARAALIHEGRRATAGRLRIENRC